MACALKTCDHGGPKSKSNPPCFLFPYPVDSDVWMERLKYFDLRQTKKVCKCHFDPMLVDAKNKLQDGAVPFEKVTLTTEFPDTEDHLKRTIESLRKQLAEATEKSKERMEGLRLQARNRVLKAKQKKKRVWYYMPKKRRGNPMLWIQSTTWSNMDQQEAAAYGSNSFSSDGNKMTGTMTAATSTVTSGSLTGDVKPDIRRDVKPDIKPDIRMDIKPDINRMVVKPEIQRDIKPIVKVKVEPID